MLCSIASLDKEKLAAVKALEGRLGKTLIAFSCTDLNATALTDSELAQIREAEKKLDLALVAVK